MDISILQEIGFTESEAKIYISLLELGKSPVQKIVEKSGVSKAKTYEILLRLVGKGIVSEIHEDKIRHYEPMNPKELLTFYNNKQKIFEENKKKLEKALPEYENLFSIQNKSEATIYRGYNGIKKVLNMMIDDLGESDMIHTFCTPYSPGDFQYFYEWDRKRREKKIKIKVIYHKDANLDGIKKLENIDKKLFEYKMITPEFYTPTVFEVFGDKTAIFIWGDEPLVVLVNNKQTSDSFRKYFQVLWNLAK